MKRWLFRVVAVIGVLLIMVQLWSYKALDMPPIPYEAGAAAVAGHVFGWNMVGIFGLVMLILGYRNGIRTKTT